MPFTKTFTAPNGAVLTYHRVGKAEVFPDNASFWIQSWVDEQAFLDGKPPLYNTPMQINSVLTLLAQLETSVVEGDNPFGGATIVSAAGADIEQLRRRQWAAIKDSRDKLDNKPIPVPGADFSLDGDQSSRIDIMGGIMSMQASGVETIEWRCADNVMRSLTLQQLTASGTAIAARRAMLIGISDPLYQQLQAAGTAAEIEAIIWPQSMPAG